MIEAGGHVKFEVSGEDLRHFAEQLIEKAAQLVARPTEPPKEKWLTQKEACSSAVSARPLSGNGAAEVTSSPPNSATATCICHRAHPQQPPKRMRTKIRRTNANKIFSDGFS